MKTWAVLLIFTQLGFSIRFEFYELDELIAIANNGIDVADHENESQNTSENMNDPDQAKEGENEVLKMMTRIKRMAEFSTSSNTVKQELCSGTPLSLLYDIIDIIF